MAYEKERRAAWMLFVETKVDGYGGCYSRVTDFIRVWRQREGGFEVGVCRRPP